MWQAYHCCQKLLPYVKVLMVRFVSCFGLRLAVDVNRIPKQSCLSLPTAELVKVVVVWHQLNPLLTETVPQTKADDYAT